MLLITTAVLVVLFNMFRANDFGEFIRAEYRLGTSSFTRDNTHVTESGRRSYKIQSDEFNNAIFYKTLEVMPNTLYRVTAMVKTENVESEDTRVNAGAAISIVGTFEISRAITGTNDWQEIEFKFNSRDRESVEIGFRLGGNRSDSRGTAWFSDFTVEEGTREESSYWRMACFIIRNVDAYIGDSLTVPEENINLSMTKEDENLIRANMRRFQNTVAIMSENRMSVSYEIYEIDVPLTTLSYSQQFGYHVDAVDIRNIIENYIKEREYDHVFVVVRLGDERRNVEIPIYDWIGLRRYGHIRSRPVTYQNAKRSG